LKGNALAKRSIRFYTEENQRSQFYPEPGFGGQGREKVKRTISMPFRERDVNRPVYPWQDPIVWKAHFERTAHDLRTWQEEARSLACAAGTLLYALSERPPRFDRNVHLYLKMKSVLFLYAAAVENLVKAVWIARGGQPISAGILTKELGTHKLRRLARQANIIMSTEENDILRWLEGLIESGKYPIARSLERQLKLGGFGLGTLVPPVLNLLQRLEQELALAAPPHGSWRPIDFTTLGAPKGQAVITR
jgi:hypothetical protein